MLLAGVKKREALGHDRQDEKQAHDLSFLGKKLLFLKKKGQFVFGTDNLCVRCNERRNSREEVTTAADARCNL